MVEVSDGQMGLLVLFGACTGIYAGLELVRLRILLKVRDIYCHNNSAPKYSMPAIMYLVS